ESARECAITAAWILSPRFFSCPGSPLLENQRARPHALDVQHWEPGSCDRTLSESSNLDTDRRALDDPGFSGLVVICGVGVGSISLVHSRARWRDYCGPVGASKSQSGSRGVALCASMVSRSATALSSHNASRDERQCLAKNLRRMATNVHCVLEVLA